MVTAPFSFMRAGVIAVALLTGFGGTAMPAPLGAISGLAPQASPDFSIERVRDGNRARLWPRHGGRGAWSRGNWNGNRAWRGRGNGGGRYWNRGRNWNGGRYWNGGRGNYWRGNDYDYDNFGIGLGLGLAVPLFGGYYPGYYGNGYYAPSYYPRRYYRTGTGQQRWCYARYRSYRAWDNTYQPYYGPRRQCYLPG
ncbi:MAG TPA: BA14K family protein [Mesorhizobium sp.]|jgi:hypothetical protein